MAGPGRLTGQEVGYFQRAPRLFLLCGNERKKSSGAMLSKYGVSKLPSLWHLFVTTRADGDSLGC